MTAPAPLDLPALLDDLERAHAAIGDSPAFRVVGYVQDDENPEWVLARFADEGTSVFAECYGTDAAALIVAAVNAVPMLIAELGKRAAAPSPAVEPPHDLREDLAEWLFRYNRGPLTFWHEISEVAKDSRRDDADQLLAGPLAPLLARLTRAEAAHRHIAAIAAANPGSKGTHYADAARILTAGSHVQIPWPQVPHASPLTTAPTRATGRGVQLWWHAYGGVREDLGGCWQLVVYGPGTAAPRIAAEIDPPRGCRYLASWDHAPSDAEKDEVTPEEYRDEEQPMTAPSPAAAGLPAEDVHAPAWVHAVTPAEIVRQRALRWPDFHPEDFCHQCGRRNPVWFADTEVWQEATGSTGDGGGILCPSCFAALYRLATGRDAIIWRLSIDPRSRDYPEAAAALAEMRPTAAEEAVTKARRDARGVHTSCDKWIKVERGEHGTRLTLTEPERGLCSEQRSLWANLSPRAVRELVADLRAALAPVPHDADGGERR